MSDAGRVDGEGRELERMVPGAVSLDLMHTTTGELEAMIPPVLQMNRGLLLSSEGQFFWLTQLEQP